MANGYGLFTKSRRWLVFAPYALVALQTMLVLFLDALYPPTARCEPPSGVRGVVEAFVVFFLVVVPPLAAPVCLSMGVSALRQTEKERGAPRRLIALTYAPVVVLTLIIWFGTLIGGRCPGGPQRLPTPSENTNDYAPQSDFRL